MIYWDVWLHFQNLSGLYHPNTKLRILALNLFISCSISIRTGSDQVDTFHHRLLLFMRYSARYVELAYPKVGRIGSNSSVNMTPTWPLGCPLPCYAKDLCASLPVSMLFIYYFYGQYTRIHHSSFIQLPRMFCNLIGSNRVMWHSVDCTVASKWIYLHSPECRYSAFGMAHFLHSKFARSVRVMTIHSQQCVWCHNNLRCVLVWICAVLSRTEIVLWMKYALH